MPHKLYEGHADDICPIRREFCKDACPTCKFQMHVTKAGNAFWECAYIMQAALSADVAARIGGLAEATENFRNEVVTQNQQALSGAVIVAQKLLSAVPEAIDSAHG